MGLLEPHGRRRRRLRQGGVRRGGSRPDTAPLPCGEREGPVAQKREGEGDAPRRGSGVFSRGSPPSARPSPRGGEGEEQREEGDTPVIIVHSLADARAALGAAAALGIAVTLASAPAAGGYAGPGWWQAMLDLAAADFPEARFDAVLDCGAEPGTVLAALRLGLRRVRFTGNDDAARRLADIAAQQGAVLEREAPEAALDLLDCRDPAAACRAFLAGNAPAG